MLFKSVGVVGWFTGGGHGFLSSTYGMGADNLLEATVVTPRGDIVVTNQCQYPDLFYAIRGGGGGTYGVVMQATVKAFRTPKTTFGILKAALIDPLHEEDWWEFIGYLHTQLAALKDKGGQGYYYFVGPPMSPVFAFYIILNFYDKPDGTFDEAVKPIVDYFRANPSVFYFNISVETSPTFFGWYNATVSPEAVANGNNAMGSRLLSRQALSKNQSELATAFKSIGPKLSGNVRPIIILKTKL